MENINIQLIEEIKKLYVEDKKRQLHIQKVRDNDFCLFCDKLQKLYNQETERIFKQYIDPFLNSYTFLNEKSSLQIIKKSKYEDYHSSFLAHLWGSETEFGYKVFQDFINDISTNKELWVDNIQQFSYKIINNKPIEGQRKKGLNKKRPDLIFVDEKNKWCVIIENKIESKVHYPNNRSQLDNYFDFGEREYKDYHKLYILLSYKNNKEHIKGEWIYSDYYPVFKSLLKFHAEDSLIQDYLKTLFTLLFSNEQINDYSTHSLYRGILFYNRILSKIKIK